MSDAPLGDHRDRLESSLAARRFATRLGEAVHLGDHVPRRLAYEEAHPDVGIREPCVHDGMWTAVLEGGAVEVRAPDLMLLLDELEARDRPGAP